MMTFDLSTTRTFGIGDLIAYGSFSGGPVKGKVIDIMDDVGGRYVAFRVTSLDHVAYPRGMEVVVLYNTPWLTKRKRYSHG